MLHRMSAADAFLGRHLSVYLDRREIILLSLLSLFQTITWYFMHAATNIPCLF